jgi:hypothetical protein
VQSSPTTAVQQPLSMAAKVRNFIATCFVLIFVGPVVAFVLGQGLPPSVPVYLIGIALAVGAIVALLKPLPVPVLNVRWQAGCLLWVSLFFLLGGVAGEDERTLKDRNPSAYLERLKPNDKAWLEALKEMRPQEYEAVLVQRAEAAQREAEAKAERERQQAADRAVRLEREALEKKEREAREAAELAALYDRNKSDYLTQLASEIVELGRFNARSLTGSKEQIIAALNRIDGWASFIDKGTAFRLTPQQEAQRTDMRRRLSALQVQAFPVLRDAYGPLMRQVLWEHDAKMRTFGPGFRTVEVISAHFAANRNIQQIHNTVEAAFTRMRFTRAQYKWLDANVEYSYYSLASPADGDVVVWSGSSFRKAD